MRIASTLLLIVMAAANVAQTDDAASLRLIQTIPLKGTDGRIDHICLSERHLCIASRGNNSVEIVDAEGGSHAGGVGNVKAPQGVSYIAESKRLIVTSGGEGLSRIALGSGSAGVQNADVKHIEIDVQSRWHGECSPNDIIGRSASRP